MRIKKNRLLAALLSITMVLFMLPVSGATALAAESRSLRETDLLIKPENIEVRAIRGDGSAGDILDLSMEEGSDVFSGKLANYTDLAEYNDADIAVTLRDLPEGTSAELQTGDGQLLSPFAAGTAGTRGGTVSKGGEYSFIISLQKGEEKEEYTLKLKKTAAVTWKNLVFEGNPAFNSLVTYYGAPEGTLFRLNNKGERTGETGLSENCFDYEVYVSAATMAVKPAGTSMISIFKSFSYVPNCKTSVYIDGELLPGFENIPTAMSAAMKWSNLTEGVRLIHNRTEMRIVFRISDTEVVNTTVTFVVVGTMNVEDFIPLIENLNVDTLVYPDDRDDVLKLYQNFMNYSEEEKDQIPDELKEKLEHAYGLMVNDRVPSKLEIVKPAVKLMYGAGQTFNPTGTELLATYDDGTTRTITEGFIVVPDGALSKETEITYIYNTMRVTQPIKVVENTLAGEGTQENPYQLADGEDLQNLNAMVASGQSTEGLYFVMTDDITLPADWTPIGVTIDGTKDIKKGTNLYAFSGVFDGKNHTLTVPEGGRPLLGYVKGAEVRNLNIYGTKIAGYGLVDHLEGVGLSGSSVLIDNVTLKSGSSTLKSGLLGANITTNGFAGCSAGFVATVRNCTVEKNVIIGYNKDQSMIGSIAGRMQGTVEHCVSYATVYGQNYVGGIIGTRDNAMGVCTVTDCEFGGTVSASGHHAGGIVGGGYSNGTAPNGHRAEVTNCSSNGKVSGADKVGGIMGADTYVLQSWGEATFKQNTFYGTVEATDGEYAGGIIGYLGSLNKYDQFTANYYSNTCGAAKGIAFVKYVDTDCETHETESGTVYFNTSVKMPGISGISKDNHNRSDDPLGVDSGKLCYTDSTPAVATELIVSGSYKTEYIKGDTLDLTGIIITVSYNNGRTETISAADAAVTGFDSEKVGRQEIILSYKGLTAAIQVQVWNPEGEITVIVSILGDRKHDCEADGKVHTLADNTLEVWVPAREYTVNANATVLDVLSAIVEANNMTMSNPTGSYIESLTRNGVTLKETDNHANSGWMFAVNGVHGDRAVNQQYMNQGDTIIFHYTDDYTKESGFGDTADRQAAEAVKNQIAAIGTPITLDGEKAITAARKAYDALTDTQRRQVTNYDVLTAAERALAELKKTEEDEAAADAVEKQIAAIGTPVTLERENAIMDARGAYNNLTDLQKKLVDNYNELITAENQLLQLKNPSHGEIYKGTGGYLVQQSQVYTPGVGSVGGEWMIIGLARSGRSVPAGYYANALTYIKEHINEKGQLNRNRSTDNARVILAWTALGYDVTDIDGQNLLMGLTDMTYIKKQGINGPVWALIALDSHGYDVPPNSQAADPTTREKLIAYILEAQLSDGGWSLSKDVYDSDVTAMALQALAPYYSTKTEVRAAVDRALELLSRVQNADGSFSALQTGGWYLPTAESTAQVVVALTALGINPETDARFVKNGNSVVDALCGYAVEGGGFGHTDNDTRDGMATEQGYYALAAYYRFLNGDTGLYDMNDVMIGGQNPQTGDNVNGMRYPGLLLLSLAGLAAAVAISARKKRIKA